LSRWTAGRCTARRGRRQRPSRRKTIRLTGPASRSRKSGWS
jgi:hypothetical protein